MLDDNRPPHLTLEQRLAALGLGERRRIVHGLVPLDAECGLEIAPNWAPLVTKSESNVLYCDYLSYEQLLEREKENPGRMQYGLRVQRLDFQWAVGRTLKESLPEPLLFDYVVSSHVLEHVPNFLEYLYQIREVTRDEGTIAFVLPDIRGSGEFYRRETTAADLLDAYLLGHTRPTPGMVYDSLKHLFAFENEPYGDRTLDEVKRYFTDAACLDAAVRATVEYVDTHCWAFSRDGFVRTADELKGIGLFDFDVVDIVGSQPTATGHGAEFYVKLRPTAPARPSRLRQSLPAASLSAEAGEAARALEAARAEIDRLTIENRAAGDALQRVADHGEKAFREAVAAQDTLKAEKATAEARLAALKRNGLVRLGRALGLVQ